MEIINKELFDQLRNVFISNGFTEEVDNEVTEFIKKEMIDEGNMIINGQRVSRPHEVIIKFIHDGEGSISNADDTDLIPTEQFILSIGGSTKGKFILKSTKDMEYWFKIKVNLGAS